MDNRKTKAISQNIDGLSGNYKIVQIAPTSRDYLAVYEVNEEKEKFIYFPVTAWLLIEYLDGQSKGLREIVGLTMCGTDTPAICEDTSKFAGYVTKKFDLDEYNLFSD